MKTLFIVFEDQEMCFNHILLYADEAFQKGDDFKVIFEGAAVKMPSKLMEKEHPLFLKALERNQIEGICEACSRMMEVYEINKELPIDLLGDMKGHPSLTDYQSQGYEIYFK